MPLDIDSPDRCRTEAALAHKKHDRVPVIEFHIDPVNMRRLAGGPLDWPRLLCPLGRVPSDEHFAVCERLGFDLAPFCATGPFFEIPQGSAEGSFKIGGLNTREDLARVLPRPSTEEILRAAKETIDRAAQRNMGVWAFVLSPFSSVYLGMGLERFWTKMCEDPRLIEDAFDLATAYIVELMEPLCELDFATIYLGDDIAINNGLILHPQTMRAIHGGYRSSMMGTGHA